MYGRFKDSDIDQWVPASKEVSKEMQDEMTGHLKKWRIKYQETGSYPDKEISSLYHIMERSCNRWLSGQLCDWPEDATSVALTWDADEDHMGTLFTFCGHILDLKQYSIESTDSGALEEVGTDYYLTRPYYMKKKTYHTLPLLVGLYPKTAKNDAYHGHSVTPHTIGSRMRTVAKDVVEAPFYLVLGLSALRSLKR